MLPTRSKTGRRWCDDIVDYTLKHHHHNDNSRCWPENESFHLFLVYTYVNRILVNSIGAQLHCYSVHNWNGENMSEQSHMICSAHTTDAQLTVMMTANVVMHNVYKSFGWHENAWKKLKSLQSRMQHPHDSLQPLITYKHHNSYWSNTSARCISNSYIACTILKSTHNSEKMSTSGWKIERKKFLCLLAIQVDADSARSSFFTKLT